MTVDRTAASSDGRRRGPGPRAPKGEETSRTPAPPGRGPGSPARRRTGPTLAVLAALALAGAPTAAGAQGRDTPSLSFDAFGTLGLVYSTEDRADFVWNPLRPDGPGHSEEISPDVDSRLGGQLTARLTPRLTAVVQVVTEQNHDDDYAPHLEWAYVRYDFTPDFSVRAGRSPISAFLVSEFRKVSYANPWIRPPVELYGLSPIFSGEGVDADYRLHLGDWTNTLEVGFGWSDDEFPGGIDVQATHTWNLSNTIQRGALTGRLAFSTGLLDIDDFDPFFDAFRAFGPEGDAIAERFELDETPFEFATVGMEYDPGPWFAMAEVGWADFNSALGEKIAGYVSGGYRIGPMTPYATYSRVEALNDTSVPGLSLEGLPPGPAQTAAQLNAGLNMFLQAAPVQQNVSLGGRWDFARGVALKLQADFVDVFDGSPGTFINRQPEFERGGSAQVLSLATVFVF